jgi:hypothetical protein
MLIIRMSEEGMKRWFERSDFLWILERKVSRGGWKIEDRGGCLIVVFRLSELRV